MPTLNPSHALVHDLEAAVRQAIQVLTRVMEAASQSPADQPLPKPLTQARLAATQILRFAARLFGSEPASGRSRSLLPAAPAITDSPRAPGQPERASRLHSAPPPVLAPRPAAGRRPAGALIAAAGAPVGNLKAAAA